METFEYAHCDKMKQDSQISTNIIQVTRCRHLIAQGYRDSDGQPLHPYDNSPMVNVMMVGAKLGCSEDGKIYQRLGFGEIYFQRWVEASDKRETLFIE